jgi:hypothetical protein
MPEFLQRRLGPLPMGAWLLAVAGGLLFAYFIRRMPGPAPVAREEEFFGEEGSVRLPPTQGPVQLPGGPASRIDLEPAAIEDNQVWRRVAIEFAVARGISATVATRAVGKFLAGDRLTAEENAVIEIIIHVHCRVVSCT